MSMDKKKAARQAAAKYSTDPMAAALEYGKLSEQIDPLFTFDELDNEHRNTIDELKQELLGLLPQYRHPTNDEFAEHMIFIDPDPPPYGGTGHSDPEFLSLMKKENVPADMLEAVDKYVKESELSKIELNECKDKLGELKETIEKVSRIYKKDGYKSSGERNTATVQALGLSTGKAQPRIDIKKAYNDSVNFVRKKGMSREDATQKIKKLHGYNSCDAALKALYNYRKTIFDKSPCVRIVVTSSPYRSPQGEPAPAGAGSPCGGTHFSQLRA